VTPNANDLTVTGGGGTRINEEGKVEDVVYNVFGNSLNLPIHASHTIVSTNNLAPDGTMTASLIEVATNTNYYFYRHLEGDMPYASNISIFAKHVVGSSPVINLSFNSEVQFDVQTG